MQVLIDEWTPLFDDLAFRLSPAQRALVNEEIALQLKDSALSNFGGEMSAGDMRTWSEEKLLSKNF